MQEAKWDEKKMEALIEQSLSYILKCASVVSRRYITNSDDEWSVALSAFSQAVMQYDPGRGSFYSFAEILIRRRLIDYFRSQERFRAEILASPEVFSSGSLEDSPQPSLQAAVSAKLLVCKSEDLRLEIEAASQVFAQYGFSFFDLSNCSPKAAKTRECCAKAVAFLLKQSMNSI